MLKPSPQLADGPRPGARALYLGGRDKKQVSCTEEALVVRNDRAQTLRYPLARVARVVSSTVVDWSGAALALCLRQGIGISWIDTRGEALGTCYPRQRCHPKLACAVELWLEAPMGMDHYRHWLRSRRMDVLVRWGGELANGVDPAQWEGTKREWVYASQFRQHLPSSLRSHLLAYTGAQLAAHGVPPLAWGAQAQAIDLDEDLCELLWAEMNLCCGTLTDAAQGDREIITLFERWTARNGAALVLHLSSLYRTAMRGSYP